MGNSWKVEDWVKEDTKYTWSETLWFRGLSGTQGTESRNKSIVTPLVCTENTLPLASLKKRETLAECLCLNFPAAKISCSDKISLLFSKGYVSVIRGPLRKRNFQYLGIILLHSFFFQMIFLAFCRIFELYLVQRVALVIVLLWQAVGWISADEGAARVCMTHKVNVWGGRSVRWSWKNNNNKTKVLNGRHNFFSPRKSF